MSLFLKCGCVIVHYIILAFFWLLTKEVFIPLPYQSIFSNTNTASSANNGIVNVKTTNQLVFIKFTPCDADRRKIVKYNKGNLLIQLC